MRKEAVDGKLALEATHSHFNTSQAQKRSILLGAGWQYLSIVVA